jgi:NADH-quinone oxidoreductase subunit L
VLDLRVDQQFIDAIANGLGNLTRGASARLRRLQNGFVRSYALAVLLGVVIILGYLLLK